MPHHGAPNCAQRTALWWKSGKYDVLEVTQPNKAWMATQRRACSVVGIFSNEDAAGIHLII